MMKDLNPMIHDDRLKKLRILSLEKKKQMEDMIALLKYLIELHVVEG